MFCSTGNIHLAVKGISFKMTEIPRQRARKTQRQHERHYGRQSRKSAKLKCCAFFGSDSIPRTVRCVDASVPVAPASRQLLALSWNSNTTGKMLALLQQTAALLRHKSQSVRRQLEWAYSFKLRRYSFFLFCAVCFLGGEILF